MIRRQANGFVMLEMASKERGLPGLGDRTLREEGEGTLGGPGRDHVPLQFLAILNMFAALA